jgi:hypothetical protein
MSGECEGESCKDLQEMEWQILEVCMSTWILCQWFLHLHTQATYPDTLPPDAHTIGEPFTLEIGVELEKPIIAHVESLRGGPSHLACTAPISRLPPLYLTIILPPTYPNHDPPHIHSLRSECNWIPSESLDLLAARLLEMWNNGNMVLPLWILCIRNGEGFLNSIGLLPAGSQSMRLTPILFTLLN